MGELVARALLEEQPDNQPSSPSDRKLGRIFPRRVEKPECYTGHRQIFDGRNHQAEGTACSGLSLQLVEFLPRPGVWQILFLRGLDVGSSRLSVEGENVCAGILLRHAGSISEGKTFPPRLFLSQGNTASVYSETVSTAFSLIQTQSRMAASPDLIALARTAALKHSLDPALVCAVAEQESSWDTHAIRYEPGFRTRYVAPLGLSPTEEIARSISWGLMQVMGQVAREHGFQEKFLSALCDSVAGLDIGCAALAAKIAAAGGNVSGALTMWNGGANPNYAQEVLARMASYK
jgi:hypothetical protein